MNAAYYKKYGAYGWWYVLLKPTGRWKIESTAHYRDRLFIEHRNWLWFCDWIPAKDIEFKPAPSCTINECSS